MTTFLRAWIQIIDEHFRSQISVLVEVKCVVKAKRRRKVKLCAKCIIVSKPYYGYHSVLHYTFSLWGGAVGLGNGSRNTSLDITQLQYFAVESLHLCAIFC